jgi:hypothetical protein
MHVVLEIREHELGTTTIIIQATWVSELFIDYLPQLV